VHEIQRPDFIDLHWKLQWLPRPLDQSPFGAPLLIQPQLSVRAVHALVVAPLAHLSQPVEALPETTAQLDSEELV
jgi:hypothetical protein